MSLGHPRWTAFAAVAGFCVTIATPILAQHSTETDALALGRELFQAACANCHGADGTGSSAHLMALPVEPPDFTESSFASREPHGDWAGVATLGGPLRGFDRMMPSFADALSRDEIDLILDYMQTLYEDKSWPRGEFNIPLALGTEKAFPEDEIVMKTTGGTGDVGSVDHKIIYENRLGSQTQLEFVIPVGLHEMSDDLGSPTGEWSAGLGDVAIGLKRALFHDLGLGSIVSVTFEAILPTGDESEGFGKGFTVFEPFVTYGQLLPLDAFFQMQAGVELPTNTDEAENEGLLRMALGKTFTVGGEWGRAFSPMVEFLGKKELADGHSAVWDIMPEMQVTLNQRQHIMANVGVRIPLTQTAGRDPQLLFYILWDWFDGGFFEGW